MSGRQAWGDDDDDDEYLPPRQESAVDSKGVKSIVEYYLNDNGAKVRGEHTVLYEVPGISYGKLKFRYIVSKCPTSIHDIVISNIHLFIESNAFCLAPPGVLASPQPRIIYADTERTVKTRRYRKSKSCRFIRSFFLPAGLFACVFDHFVLRVCACLLVGLRVACFLVCCVVVSFSFLVLFTLFPSNAGSSVFLPLFFVDYVIPVRSCR